MKTGADVAGGGGTKSLEPRSTSANGLTVEETELGRFEALRSTDKRTGREEKSFTPRSITCLSPPRGQTTVRGPPATARTMAIMTQAPMKATTMLPQKPASP